jgi:hypothetical protein
MKNVPALCVGILLGAAVFGSLSFLRAEPPQATPPTAQIGRYQFAHGDGINWFVDTATGDNWSINATNKWTKGANPVLEKK